MWGRPGAACADWGSGYRSRASGTATLGGTSGACWPELVQPSSGSYPLFKALTRGSGRIAVNRSAARRIIELPEFRGAGAGQGEGWLSACVHGPLSTSEGVGGPTEWLRAGNLQHMTYVVRSLPGG
nr:beta family protein [Streptomyces luteolifulvus]